MRVVIKVAKPIAVVTAVIKVAKPISFIVSHIASVCVCPRLSSSIYFDNMCTTSQVPIITKSTGYKAAIAVTLIAWLFMIALAYSATTPARFWFAANIAGFSLGASQSAGRALVAYLSPKSHRAEFFGLWGLAVKLSSILGPLTYGLTVWISAGNHRLAMLLTGIYFVVGLMILLGVNIRRGRKTAMRMNRLGANG